MRANNILLFCTPVALLYLMTFSTHACHVIIIHIITVSILLYNYDIMTKVKVSIGD